MHLLSFAIFATLPFLLPCVALSYAHNCSLLQICFCHELSFPQDKLQSSSPVAAQILSLLVVLLQQHYDEGHYFPTAYDVRKKVKRGSASQ